MFFLFSFALDAFILLFSLISYLTPVCRTTYFTSNFLILNSQVWIPPLLSCSVLSNSLQPHGLQHTRLPCPSPSPRALWNSCPLSWWYHTTILSSVVLFSSRLQSFPASGSFPVRQFFASGGQSIGASASASVLPMNIQDWFPLGLNSLISLQSKGLSSLLQHHSSKSWILWSFFTVQHSYPYMTTRKTWLYEPLSAQ